MFITPVSCVNNTYNATQVQNKYAQKFYGTANAADTVSFSGKPQQDPEFQKNQLRVLLTQDYRANKLAVKMPETELEKEVLLEVLKHRKNLDKYVRCRNEKMKILWDFHDYITYPEDKKDSPEFKELEHDLFKRGNLVKVLDNLNETLAQEEKKHRASLDYFKNIEAMNDNYQLVKVNALEKFWRQIEKNNINSNPDPKQKYKTEQLIDIVSGKMPLPENPEVEKPKPTGAWKPKKVILAEAREKYEKFLREEINIYRGANQGEKAIQGQRKLVYNINTTTSEKYPHIESDLSRVFKEVRDKYMRQKAILGQTEIFAVEKIWEDMDQGITEMKNALQEIAELQKQSEENPEDKSISDSLELTKQQLAETKKLWIEYLIFGNQYEQKNRDMFVEMGKGDAYDYLTGICKEILRYKELEKICNENNGELPEEEWAKLLAA